MKRFGMQCQSHLIVVSLWRRARHVLQESNEFLVFLTQGGGLELQSGVAAQQAAKLLDGLQYTTVFTLLFLLLVCQVHRQAGQVAVPGKLCDDVLYWRRVPPAKLDVQEAVNGPFGCRSSCNS